MYFLHYWVQKGKYTLEDLLNLSIYDKYFLIASMLVDMEEKGQAWEKLSV